MPFILLAKCLLFAYNINTHDADFLRGDRAMEEKKRSVVTHLNNTYTEKKTLQSIREYKYKRFVKRRTMAILVAGIALIALFTFPLIRGYSQMNELEEERTIAMQELEEIELEQEELEYYIGLLENEEYVAKLARSEYYVTQDNEIVFSFPDDRTQDLIEDENE